MSNRKDNSKYKLAIGSDHGGWDLKEYIKKFLADKGYDFVDVGTADCESVDYPDYGALVINTLLQNKAQRGILVCGTGIGMSIVANKYPGVRAALCYDEFTAQMSREHNNSNVLVLGGRIIKQNMAAKILQTWLTTEFTGGRHSRRLDKITKIEQEICTKKVNN